MNRSNWVLFGIIWASLAIFESTSFFLDADSPRQISFLQSTGPRLVDFGLVALLAPWLLLVTLRLQSFKIPWWGMMIAFIGMYPLFCVIHAFLWNLGDRVLWSLGGGGYSYIHRMVASGALPDAGFLTCLVYFTRTDLTGIFMHYLLVVTLVNALIFHQQNYEKGLRTSRLEAGLAQARLQALTAQLQPHFLFNTLNAISCLVHVNPDAADEMIGKLSRLFRRTIEKRDTPMIPFRGEMDFIQEYLEIEQVRFGERLTFAWEIEPAAQEVPILFMTLQPLVENAIRHGVAAIPGEGLIRISAKVVRRTLEVMVEDNGPGLAEGWSEGFGLKATRFRLAQLYGADFSLHIANAGPAGVRVCLRIPVKPAALLAASDSETTARVSQGADSPCVS